MTDVLDLVDRLIVPLDVPSPEEAETTVALLGDKARFYKIGYQLMPVGGLQLAEQLSAAGKKVFLDFKFHDIGATVERGVKSVCKLGGDFLTVHAEPDVLKGAVEGRGDDVGVAGLERHLGGLRARQTLQFGVDAGRTVELVGDHGLQRPGHGAELQGRDPDGRRVRPGSPGREQDRQHQQASEEIDNSQSVDPGFRRGVRVEELFRVSILRGFC